MTWRPAVTVVIPAFGEEPWLAALLDALHGQSLQPAAVFLVHSGRGDPSPLAVGRPLVRVWHCSERRFAGAARNIGVAHAETEWVAFLDADVLPGPDWLETMLRAAQSSSTRRFVVGSVVSGGTGGYWGEALWAWEFSSVHPFLPNAAKIGGASANLLVPHDLLLLAGGFPEAFRCAEDTVLLARLRQGGAENWFCADAPVRHRNPGGALHFMRQAFMHGCWAAFARRVVRVRVAVPRALWAFFWPFIGLSRFLLSAGRILRWGHGLRGRYLLLAPAVLLGCLIWNLGFMASWAWRPPAAAGRPMQRTPSDDQAPSHAERYGEHELC